MGSCLTLAIRLSIKHLFLNLVLLVSLLRTGRLVLKKLFFCVGEYAEYGFDQQRLIYGMFVACRIRCTV